MPNITDLEPFIFPEEEEVLALIEPHAPQDVCDQVAALVRRICLELSEGETR